MFRKSGNLSRMVTLSALPGQTELGLSDSLKLEMQTSYCGLDLALVMSWYCWLSCDRFRVVPGRDKQQLLETGVLSVSHDSKIVSL